LSSAQRGDSAQLEQLLTRHGHGHGRGPNLKLAAAFGAEVARLPGAVSALLDRLGRDDAAPDDARVFLPIAAAHGWAHRLREGHDVEAAWAALAELAGDERPAVRVGTREALIELTMKDTVETLIERARAWLELEDREIAFGAAALVIECVGDARLVTVVRDPDALFSYLSRVLEKIDEAPRAAARSDGRRRALTSIADTAAGVIARVRGGERWFAGECERASHPDIRAALSQALLKLSRGSHAPGGAVIEQLRKTLEASAKPLRDAARVRPGSGRGRRSRMTR
jgi:hypothetical protein